ncbi:hypothetical protein HPB58_12390 [Priestia filamentosa]|nr:hypothetical protein [Priestia filamentosa]UOE62916.1 hypothetical protein HPB58_12390 [Priestia filamentosa]
MVFLILRGLLYIILLSLKPFKKRLKKANSFYQGVRFVNRLGIVLFD